MLNYKFIIGYIIVSLVVILLIENTKKITEGMDLYLCGTHEILKENMPMPKTYDYPFCYFDQL